MLRPSVTRNSTSPSANAARVFGAVELLVADQQCDDLHRDGGHGLERIRRQVCRQACCHHHDHRLADGTRDGQQHAAHNAGKRGAQYDAPDRFRAACHPARRTPSRSDCGTAVIMSSDSDDTNGMIMTPITSPAASALPEATLARRSPRHRAARDPRSAPRRIRTRLWECPREFPAAAWRQRESAVGILGKIDRRKQADRYGDQHRDRRDEQGAGEQRHRAECARGADLIGADRSLRTPLGPEDEIAESGSAGRSESIRTVPRAGYRWS